ncbi:hypothetical protein HGI47_18770 [Novosphingobium sp. ERN07]|nr:hypothetical protein [Novosphingobium sp. ERN07]
MNTPTGSLSILNIDAETIVKSTPEHRVGQIFTDRREIAKNAKNLMESDTIFETSLPNTLSLIMLNNKMSIETINNIDIPASLSASFPMIIHNDPINITKNIMT